MTSTASSDREANDAPLRPDGLVSTSEHPLIPGFHPDPTICRVGEDYYVAHSSSEFTPGVPIWHSRDLLDWTLIGNALTRDDQFKAGSARASAGVFAPTLRYRDGRFWLITTDVSGGGGQLVVSAEDPAGRWSDGFRLGRLVGIDPDLSWDQDGVCYVTYCSTDAGGHGIVQARVDLDAGVVVDGPRLIWRGTGLAFPEAPHLYHHDGWWYLVIAEGGTERGHGVSVARSRHPQGPFTGREDNPVFSHRSTTHPVQNTGHADLVQTPDGGWAMVYLGVRPRGITPMFHVNGRETFLAGVDWVDGWPVVDENRFRRPAPDHSFVDEFDIMPLHPRWVSPGASPASQIVEDPGPGLLLRPVEADSGAIGAVVARVQDLAWSFEADIDTTAGAGGLILRLDDRHRCEVRVGAGSGRAVVHIGPVEADYGSPVDLWSGIVTVRVESLPSLTDGPDDLLLSIIAEGRRHDLARVDGRYFSTEVAGGFTGRVVGVRALDGLVRVLSVRYRSGDRLAETR